MRKKSIANLSQTAEAVTPERKGKRKGDEGAVESTVIRDLRNAEKKRAQRVMSTVLIYSLKTDDTNFGLPYCAVSDYFALLAQKQLLPCSNCYCIGSICLSEGRITPCKPRLVLDKGV